MYLSSMYVCTDVGFFGCFKTSREFLVSRTWERKFYLLFSPNTISSNTSPHPFFIIEDLEAEEKIFQRTKIMLQNGFGLLTQENDGCPVYPLFSYLNFICRVIFCLDICLDIWKTNLENVNKAHSKTMVLS